jgi:hypothetical protein
MSTPAATGFSPSHGKEVGDGLRFIGRALQPVHVVIVTRRPGRRINSAEGSSHTLCGADRTDQDVLYADAKRGSTVRCPDCSTALRMGGAPRRGI